MFRRSAALPGVATYLALRMVLLGWLAWQARSSGVPFLGSLVKADGQHYLTIARDGYAPLPAWPAAGQPQPELPNLVFFPGYPMVVRAVHRLLAPWQVPVDVTAIGVSLLAGALAAGFIASWAARRAGKPTAIVLVALWALWPASVVLSMAYSESLFVLAAAVALWAIDRRYWLVAALAAAAAGSIRPVAAGLIAAVVLAIGAYLTRRAPSPPPASRHTKGRRHLAPPTGRLRMVVRLLVTLPVLALVSCVGMLLTIDHIAQSTGRWDGWLWLERTWWNSGSDGGRTSWAAVTLQTVLPHRLGIVVAGTIVAAVVCSIWALVRYQVVGWPALIYIACCLVMGLSGRNYELSKPRFLLVAFPMLLPPAQLLVIVWRCAVLDGRRVLARWVLRGPLRLALLATASAAVAASVNWQVWTVLQKGRSI